MKFKITMKDPDTMHDAICDAVADDVSAMEGLSNEEKAGLIERARRYTGAGS